MKKCLALIMQKLLKLNDDTIEHKILSPILSPTYFKLTNRFGENTQ